LREAVEFKQALRAFGIVARLDTGNIEGDRGLARNECGCSGSSEYRTFGSRDWEVAC